MSDGDTTDLNHNRGNRADYVLGTLLGWDAFKVIRWHGVEALSSPHRFEIDVLRPLTEGLANLDTLLNTGVTFRIATKHRWRAIHGIVLEAEELDRTATLAIYRFVVGPHICRAQLRSRCRNFVDRPLQEIITAVLENRSPKFPKGNGGLVALPNPPTATDREPDFSSFTEPTAHYRWAVSDTSRITDTTVYPYVVQYNESDFHFLSRLLEREGLTYYFEHAQEGLVLTITDRPGQEPLFSEDESFEHHGYSTVTSRNEEVIRSLREPRRLQTAAVTMRDHDWRRHHIRLESSVQEGSADADILGHFEYPAGDRSLASQPTEYPAKIALERFQTTRSLAHGVGTARRLEPGRRFTAKDPAGSRPDTRHLVVRSETYATELSLEGTILDSLPFGFGK